VGEPKGKTRVDNMEMHLGEREDEVMLTGLVWLRIGTGGWLL
jgi:hypothetical protein